MLPRLPGTEYKKEQATPLVYHRHIRSNYIIFLLPISLQKMLSSWELLSNNQHPGVLVISATKRDQYKI